MRNNGLNMDKKSRPLLLLTNDDGIHAPGIRHLWEALKDIADLAIVAPSLNASGSGVSITWTRPLQVRALKSLVQRPQPGL